MPRDALIAPPRSGWYGKLPCRGDFVGGGAPLALIEGWRAWSEAGMAAVRAGGEPARDAFLVAPCWRFAVTAGVFGPCGGVGLSGPGADAAGRLFPVIVAAEAAVADPDAALDAAGPWLDAAEAAYRAALAPGAAPLDIAALPRPFARPVRPAPRAPGFAGVWRAALPAPRRVSRLGAADAALFARLFGPAP